MTTKNLTGDLSSNTQNKYKTAIIIMVVAKFVSNHVSIRLKTLLFCGGEIYLIQSS